MIGRSILAPPGVPADRVAMLRKALTDTVKDAEFLADTEKAKLEVSPIAGEKLQAMVKTLMATAPAVVEKYKQAVRAN
jgi:tripartite-type tricarboxylate transporter receptor subunit TctC